MHCILQNIMETLFKLWNQTKLEFEQDADPVEDRHLSKDALRVISESLTDACRDIPTYLGHAPRQIDDHYRGFKAAEWEAWLKYYGAPLLDQHLGDDFVDNFHQLSQIYSLATQYIIHESVLPDLEDLTIAFVRKYEELYYYQEPSHLPVCSVNIHCLLHLASHIQDCGPARYWWQFPMERYCRIIKPLAQSKSQLSASLVNRVIINKHLHHIQFTQEPEPQPQHSYPIFLDLFVTALTGYSQRRLFEHLGGDNINIEFYKCCQLHQELTVGSKHSQHCSDINWQNDQICYQWPGEHRFTFVRVNNFIKVTYPWEAYLALVHNYSGVDIDCIKRVASFSGVGSYCWIEVTWIKSLISVIEEGNVKFIVTDVNLFD